MDEKSVDRRSAVMRGHGMHTRMPPRSRGSIALHRITTLLTEHA